MLEYRFNFMNTKIYIDKESTIWIVKNPVFHSKTKHIAIRHHFIRDAYEKKLIQVLKIHIDDNVADLLTKAFDVSRFQFLVVFQESLGRDKDGIEALLLPNLFILALTIVSTDSAKLVPLGKDSTAIETLDYMDTENAQDVGRTRDVVNEEKESAEDAFSTEGVVSTDKEKVSTDRPNVSTDRPKVSTDKEKVSTDRPNVSTDRPKVNTDKEKDSTISPDEGTIDHTEERSATPITQTPTLTTFGDDETIAQVLLNMSQAKAVSREKEKGV
ncbi:hypothetical protein Tco_0069198, partial [Tanacetum coccineum]